MSKIIAWLVGILILIVFILGAYSLYDRFEVVESVTKITLQGEARKNPLYASRIFLNRMGIPARTKQSLQGLEVLPDTNTVLLISSKRSTLSRQATNDLYAWVERGGHLIARTTLPNDSFYGDVEDEKSYQSSDPLQALLHIEADESIRLYKKIEIQLQGSKRPLKLSIKGFNPISYINNDLAQTDEAIKIESNIFILRRQIGEGMITLMSDFDFIDNRNIRKADHAEILWQLTHGLGEPDNVWLIHNDEMPALWELIWNKAWALLITLFILFILWLRYASHRFGPLIPKAPEDRRSLLEHIQASGNFYWKNQQKGKLIASTREALNQRLALTHPGWKQLSDAEKIAQLALRLERPEAEIQQLLFDPNVGLNKRKSDEFTRLIKQLEQVRTSL